MEKHSDFFYMEDGPKRRHLKAIAFARTYGVNVDNVVKNTEREIESWFNR